ncbi:MAG: hypothetical protein WKF93_07665 [Acidimicrobiales bacterium]
MHHTISATRLAATLLTLTLVACADGGDGDTEDAFCSAMEQVATRMAPSSEPTPPAEVEASFGEVVTLLDQAERTAPSELRGDVARYATAIDDYVAALAAVDFDLDAIFSTPEGTQLALATSHALTPDMVNHMSGPCGITLR